MTRNLYTLPFTRDQIKGVTTIEALAKQAKVSQKTVYNALNGKGLHPLTLQALEQAADFFGVLKQKY